MKLSETEKKQKSKDIKKLSELLVTTGAPMSGCLRRWIRKQQTALIK